MLINARSPNALSAQWFTKNPAVQYEAMELTSRQYREKLSGVLLELRDSVIT